MHSMLLRDERLSGSTPSWSNTTCFTVAEDDPIVTIMGWINAGMVLSNQLKMDNLSVMCHGFVNEKNKKGGHGLLLGQEGVHMWNVDQWHLIKNKFDWITIYACNAADVDPSVDADIGNGRALFQKMAILTNTTVLAPVNTQLYRKSINPFSWREIDFGAFEGPVYSFRPDGVITNVTPWVSAD